MKKVISFDLDGTLVSADYGNRVWLEGIPMAIAEKRGITIEEAYAFVRGEYDSVGDQHILWYNIEYWLERLGLALDTFELLARYEHHIQLTPYAKEVIIELGRKYDIIIASNAARIFVEKEIEYAGLAGCFTRVVSATTDYGMVKKEERFFTRICTDLSVVPQEIAHVGDHLVFDFEIPRKVGIESYYYNQALPNNGNVINDLRELLGRL